MANEKYIQFIANYDDWIAVKKLKIEEKTDPNKILPMTYKWANNITKM